MAKYELEVDRMIAECSISMIIRSKSFVEHVDNGKNLHWIMVGDKGI